MPNADAKRLAAVLQDPNGLEFTVGFVDRVVRTEDREAAAHALYELGKIAPSTMSFLDRAQIQAGSLVGRALPPVSMVTPKPLSVSVRMTSGASGRSSSRTCPRSTKWTSS